MGTFIGPIRIIIALATSALLLASCGQAALIAEPQTSSTTTTTLVPVFSVVGQPLLSAVTELRRHDFRVSNATSSQCSDVFPLNVVLAEFPSAGTMVPPETQVTLTASSGSCAPPCPYVYMNNFNQVQCSPSPVLTDPNQLAQALSTAAQTLMGYDPPQYQYSEFINKFDSQQTLQERNGALGDAWYSLDPASEANAFINANDQDAVLAYGAAQLGNEMNCIISGLQNCNSRSPS